MEEKEGEGSRIQFRVLRILDLDLDPGSWILEDGGEVVICTLGWQSSPVAPSPGLDGTDLKEKIIFGCATISCFQIDSK